MKRFNVSVEYWSWSDRGSSSKIISLKAKSKDKVIEKIKGNDRLKNVDINWIQEINNDYSE